MTNVSPVTWARPRMSAHGFQPRFAEPAPPFSLAVDPVLEIDDSESEQLRERLHAMVAELTQARPLPAEALTSLLTDTVRRLLAEAFETFVDRTGELEAAAHRLARAADDATCVTRIHIHPDDLDLLGSADFPWVPDHDVSPGTLRVGTAGGWLEDGPAVRFSAVLDALGGDQ